LFFVCIARQIANEQAATSKLLQEQESKIGEQIEKCPELFPENAISLLRCTSRFRVPDGTDFELKMLVSGNTELKDKLAERKKSLPEVTNLIVKRIKVLIESL